MYVLTIDCGTQSLRAIVFNQSGEMLAKEKVTFPAYSAPEAGWVEADGDMFYKTMCQAIQTFCEKHPEIEANIAGLCITTQRDGVVLVDEKGTPLRPAIIWADQRRIDRPRPMSPLHQLAFGIVGMKRTADNLSRNFKGHWVQDNEPELWAKVHKYLQISAYINFKLTGTFTDSLASQIGHVPFSYKHFRWEHQGSLKHDIFKIDNALFPALVNAGEVLGKLTEAAAQDTGLPLGLPVIAAGSDKGCETLGVGCQDNGTLSISLGSQASIQTTSREYYETLGLIPPFPAVMPGHYNPEIQVYRGYWMISWFLKEFAAKEVMQAKERGQDPLVILNEAIEKIPVGAEGLILQPYWGAGIKMYDARGAIIGFNDSHTHLHIYRAIIEGIGFALLEGKYKIEKKSGKTIKKLMISGGGSSSDVICQITADLFNLPVHRVQTYETSALGAAIAGYIGIGAFKTFEEGIEAMVHEQKPFMPRPEAVAVYEQMYHKIYKRIYPKLRPIYKRFKEL